MSPNRRITKGIVVFKSPTGGFILAVLATIPCTTAFIHFGVPLPALLGPMVGCLIVALAGFPIEDAGMYGTLARVCLGVVIGTTFTPEIVANIITMSHSLALIPAFVLVIGGVGYAFFRLIGFDRQTAFYSAMPGGLQDMLILGQQAGGNVRAMSLVHATRVLVIFTLVPFAITLVWGLDLTGRVGSRATEVPISDMVLMVISGLLGWQVAKRIGFPGASFIGPLVVTAICSMSGLINSRPPAEAFIAVQFIIGLVVGTRYSGITINELRTYVIAGIAYVTIIGVVCLTLIIVITRLLGLEPLDTFLAFLPGGQPEMAVIAVASGADVAFVATHHVFRLLLVIFCAQLFLGWLRRQ